MGWRDRDWARLDESERRSLYAAGGGSYARSSGSAHALALAVAVSIAITVAVYLVGHYPRNHPLLPEVAFNLPGFGHNYG